MSPEKNGISPPLGGIKGGETIVYFSHPRYSPHPPIFSRTRAILRSMMGRLVGIACW